MDKIGLMLHVASSLDFNLMNTDNVAGVTGFELEYALPELISK